MTIMIVHNFEESKGGGSDFEWTFVGYCRVGDFFWGDSELKKHTLASQSGLSIVAGLFKVRL